MSTLPAAGAITTKLRIPEACASHPWIGFWGNYAGLRAGFSPSESFQILSPCAVPYPFLADLYLSVDTGGGGIVSIAAFSTREAALAFGGARSSGTSKIPPASASFTPSDTQANPTGLAGEEAFNMMWNSVDGQWNRLRSLTPNDAIGLANYLVALSCNALFDVTNNVYKRQQTLPNTSTGRAKTEDAWVPIVASTAVKNLNAASTTTVYTVPAGKIFRLNWFNIYSVTATTAGAGSAIQILGNALTLSIAPTPTGAANVNMLNAGGMGSTFTAGQTIDFSIVGATGAGTAAMTISGEERYAE